MEFGKREALSLLLYLTYLGGQSLFTKEKAALYWLVNVPKAVNS